MKVALVMPTRGDRKEFVDFQVAQMDKQTKLADYLFIVDHPPLNQHPDITQRYRMGFEMAKGTDAQLVLFIEDDDAYKPWFIEEMCEHWMEAGKPDLIGNKETIYYHIFLNKYMTMKHPGRASMFLTGASTKAKLMWPQDWNPFCDLSLWKDKTISKHLIEHSLDAIGIKHGIGKSGGSAHDVHWNGWNREDPLGEILKDWVSPEHIEFYKQLKAKYGNKKSIGAGSAY